MRTAFKITVCRSIGCVVEPHHDRIHPAYNLFANQSSKQVTDIMRRYALKKMAMKKGAEAQRFEAKHLNQVARLVTLPKYIAKNIDGCARWSKSEITTPAKL